MTEMVRIVSPIDGTVFAERPAASGAEIDAAVTRARAAQREWREVPIAERVALVGRMVDALLQMNDEIIPELAWQMGRPVRFGAEKRGVEERGRHMLAIAESSLAPLQFTDKP